MTTTDVLRPFVSHLVAAFLVSSGLAASLPGTVDPSFTPQLGIAEGALVQAVAVDAEGRLLVAHSNGVVRLLPDGTRDSTFGDQAKGNGDVRVILPMPDGRVYVGGGFTVFADRPYQGLVRLQPDGTLDTNLPPANLGGGGHVASLAPTSDGRLVVGGYFLIWNTNQVVGLVRIGADGAFDPDFAKNSRPIWGGSTSVTTHHTNINDVLVPITTTNLLYNWPPPRSGTVSRLMPRPDGGWLVGPVVTAELDSEGVPRRILPRDSSAEGSYSGPCIDLPDGAILCAETVPGGAQTPTELALYQLDPSADWAETRTLRYGCDGHVVALARLPDGSLVVGGRFSSLGGQRHDRLARIRPDGTVDSSFNPLIGTAADQVRLPHANPFADSGIVGLFVQPDGSILVHGQFDTIGTTPAPGLARLLGGEAPPSAPVIGETPATMTWTEDEVGALGLVVHSALPLSVTWTRDGITLPNATNAVLDFAPIRLGDAGSYELRAANALGFVTSAPIRLDVTIGPSHEGTRDRTFRPPTASNVPRPSYDGQFVADGQHYVFGAFRNPDGVATSGMMRLLREGQVDPGFVLLRGDAEAPLVRSVRGVVARRSGGLLAIVQFERAVYLPEKPIYRLLALRPDGSADPSFPDYLPGQSAIHRLTGLLVTPDDGVLLAGWFGEAPSVLEIVKLLPDGRFDAAFARITNDLSGTIFLVGQSDGRFVMATDDGSGLGPSGFRRFLPDGQPDPSFPVQPVGTGEMRLRSLVVDAQDRILAGGKTSAGSLAPALVRLFPSGEPDPSFQLQFRSDPPHRVVVDDLVVDPEGRILLRTSSGEAGPPYLQASPIVRLLQDGRDDTTFTTERNASFFRSLALDPFGRILVIANDLFVSGSAWTVQRINPDDERRLDGPAFVDGHFGATLNTRKGRRYHVEAAESLEAPPSDWRTLREVDGDGLPFRFVDPESAPRFYRLRLSDSPGN
ncbi:MAG: hypothetical protein AB7O66_16415 [Limisphaerales bacterium]